ncbi:MAG: hypothetical protein H6732_03665 [Alphaproteobacteria bacterium]|nr:hypothetical protein [Alphaproteobacteria bacterium]
MRLVVGRTVRAVAVWSLGLLVVCTLAVSPAWAAPLPVEGVARILPVAEVPGDGRSEAQVHALLLDANGAPVTGAKLRATVTSGSVGEVADVGGGLYRVLFTAPAVKEPGRVTITLKGRTDALGPVEIIGDLMVAAAPAEQVALGASSTTLVLGRDTEATLSFTLPTSGGSGGLPTAADALVRVTSGEITRVVALGGGRFSARYQAPAVNYPHVAIVTVIDRRNPGTVWGTLSLELQGKVDYPVTAAPGSNVILRVGTREFGPVQTDASGKASVPIVVPPGLTMATQIVADGASLAESSLDLRVPDTKRVALFDIPPSVPADARVRVPVRVVVLRPDGSLDPDGVPVLSATAGRISDPLPQSPGVFVGQYTPPDGRVPMAATIQVSLSGNPNQSDAVEIALVPPLPSQIKLTTEPAQLAKAGTGLKLFASLYAADGSGLADRPLRVRAAGAALKGPTTDLQGGDYRAELSAEGDTDVLLRVIALAPPSANAVGHVVILPSRTRVAPGDAQTVTLATVDAFGLPVPGVTVELSAENGSLPDTVTTDGSGLAEVVYTAGKTAGLGIVRATAGSAKGARALWQADVDLPAPLPQSGTFQARRVLDAWDGAQGSVYVTREGGKPAPVTVPDAVASGEPALVEVTSTPDPAVFGGQASLSIQVMDADGVGVSGAGVEVFGTGGVRIGPVQDAGEGIYTATVEVPADAPSMVKLNVVVDDGAALATLELMVSGEPVAVVEPEPEPEPEPKPLVESRDRPFLRAHLSFMVSGYTFEQSPTDDSGTLLDQPLGWGGSRGGGPVPLGGEFDLRAFIPKVPYLGFQGRFRYSRYVVANPAFASDAPDNLFAAKALVIGRYPFKVKRDVVHLGVKAGFRYDDFITFRGCTAVGCTIEYEALGLPGLDAGLELGAEFWKMYMVVSGSAGFAYATVPYAGNLDVNLGFDVTKHFVIDLGFGYQKRSLQVEGADSGLVRGTLEDEQILGTVGVGFSL